jgi:hypothetical protein
MSNELAAKLERQRLAADTGVAPAPRVSKGPGALFNVYTEFPEFSRKQVLAPLRVAPPIAKVNTHMHTLDPLFCSIPSKRPNPARQAWLLHGQMNALLERRVDEHLL